MVDGVLDDVFVVQFLQDGDLPERSGRYALVISVDAYDLDCHHLISGQDAPLEDTTIGSLAQLHQQLDLLGCLHGSRIFNYKKRA
jgi:hypothetical protein